MQSLASCRGGLRMASRRLQPIGAARGLVTGHRGYVLGPLLERIRNTLFFAPSHFLAGIALGGLTATSGATLWYLQDTGKIDLWPHINKMDAIEVRPRGKDCLDSDDKFIIPLPLVMPLVGWTAAVLWTATRAFYVSRLDYALKNFYHSVTFTLASRARGDRIVQRRVMEQSLDHIVYQNTFLKSCLKAAAREASTNSPVLAMPSEQAELVMETIRGAISRVNGNGFLAMDTGAPYREARYWFALTYSPSNLRVILMSEDTVQHATTAVMLPHLKQEHISAIRVAARIIMDSCEFQIAEDGTIKPCGSLACPLPQNERIPVVGSVQIVVPVSSNRNRS